MQKRQIKEHKLSEKKNRAEHRTDTNSNNNKMHIAETHIEGQTRNGKQ